MPRPKSSDFLERMLQAAMRVFARKGLSRARMSEVAAEMGVAQGSLYNYVESKEALFYLLVDLGGRTEPAALPEQLPVRTPTQEALLRRIEEQIESTFALPKLDGALRRRNVDDARAELEGVVRELYLRTEQTREPATMLERSALDLPELFTLFFVRVRRNLLDRMTTYVRRRIESHYFQPVPDATAAARFLLESITFFARHRYSDPDLNPGDDELVRETAVQLIVRSLVAADAPAQKLTTTGTESPKKRKIRK
jgi:AcrR family transcriptional regulator